jgi:pimeloyl-ACP methyl ester carboxylesterase
LGIGLLSGTSPADESGKPESGDVTVGGSIAAESYGKDGTALIFIPGLAGGAWSWSDMVRRLAPTHAIYALTLAGFSGQPPVKAPVVDKVVADIAHLISEKRLQRPILVGHSLGAFIAFRVAIEHSDRIGAVVALDGFPVFSPLADVDAAGRRAAADKLANELARGKNAEEFRAALRAFLTARMNDPEKATAMTDFAARSDPESVVQYVLEMLSADLRPDLGKVKVPILALIAADSYKKGLPDSEIQAFYKRVFANAPEASTLIIHNARHFIYVDQPDAVAAAIEAFLAGLRMSSR